MHRIRFLVIFPLLFAQSGMAAETPTVAVGVARIDATPTHPVILAGYGGRIGEHQGIDTSLWARALVIGQEKPVAIVVLDNCGVPAAIVELLAKRLKDQGISRERLIVAATHTHNAPSLSGYATILWAGRTTDKQEEHVRQYTRFALEKMEQAVVQALRTREPMHLSWSQGRVTFGGNRRVLNNANWAGFGFQRNAPVDHSLPVLAARDSNGELRAIWANYACHCTTAGSVNRINGDWAGFANASMEKQFPGAVSLMTIGCGADIGPQPSGNLEIAEDHGKSVAAEVKQLLDQPTRRLVAAPQVKSRQIKLPLADPPSRAYWDEQARTGGFHGQLAIAMLAQLNQQGKIPTEVSYPVRTWTFDDDLVMVFLAGEVVVDYSVRLNRQLDWSRLWITAWANDMPGYIPSRRVLAEGGYEADFSQVYYAQPTRYKPDIEDLLVESVMEMVDPRFHATGDQPEAPFHRLPSGENETFKELAARVAESNDKTLNAVIERIRNWIPRTGPGISRILSNDHESTEWYNFAGDFRDRIFIRQQRRNQMLSWQTPPIAAKDSVTDRIVCFLGGIGWKSQPSTDGFSLLINQRSVLQFDITHEPMIWKSEDEQVELVYLPTWTSSEDSAGFFFLRFPNSSEEEITMTIRSDGENSQRWFAVDRNQQIRERLDKLARALRAGN